MADRTVYDRKLCADLKVLHQDNLKVFIFAKMVVSKPGGKLRCYLCNSLANKQKKIILHMFPKRSGNINHFKKWIHVLDLNESDDVRNLKICCKHFMETDYLTPSKGRLKPTAVPSIKVPNPLLKRDCDKNAVQKGASVTVPGNPVQVERITLEDADGQSTRSSTEDCVDVDQKVTEKEPAVERVKEVNVETETNPRFKADGLLLQRGVRLLNSLLSSVSEKSKPIAEVQASNSGQYDVPLLLKDIKRDQLPDHWSLFDVAGRACLKYFGDQTEVATRAVIVKEDMTIMVQTRGKVFSKLDFGTITCKEDLFKVLRSVSLLHFCDGLDGVCYGEGLIELKPRSGKCAVCIRTQKRIKEKNKKARKRALSRKPRQAAETSEVRRDIESVSESRKSWSSSPKVNASLQHVRETSPPPMEVEECSSVSEMNDDWREENEGDYLELAESVRCPMSEPISRLADDKPRPLASHSFTVPRYLFDLMISRLRRTQLELRTAEDSLHVQTIQAESLQKTNGKLLEKISDLRKKVFQLELQRVAPESKGDGRVLSNRADNLPYNLQKAENDFVALRDKDLMPPCWSFITTSAGLLFLFDNHEGHFTWPVGKSVLLQPDMTLSIRLLDRPMPKMNYGQMKCLMDILTALDTVASVRPCLGICGNCFGEGIVSNQARYPGRCETCRKERKQFRTEEKRKRRALLAKAEKRRKRNLEFYNLKRRLKRSVEKADREGKEITRLKQEILVLMKQHSSTSEIENIPPVRQEVVVTS